MGFFDSLPTPEEMYQLRKGKPIEKGMPRAITKPAKAKLKSEKHAEFRKAVWTRDEGKSRASGKPLAKSGTDYSRVGEVHHVLARSTNPDQIFEPSNGILLSKQEHALAETTCPNAPDKHLLDISGPVDRGQPQTFIFRDVNGKQLKRRIG